MKLITNKFKSGGLHDNHVAANWNLGNHLSVCLYTKGHQEKPGNQEKLMVVFLYTFV